MQPFNQRRDGILTALATNCGRCSRAGMLLAGQSPWGRWRACTHLAYVAVLGHVGASSAIQHITQTHTHTLHVHVQGISRARAAWTCGRSG